MPRDHSLELKMCIFVQTQNPGAETIGKLLSLTYLHPQVVAFLNHFTSQPKLVSYSQYTKKCPIKALILQLFRGMIM